MAFRQSPLITNVLAGLLGTVFGLGLIIAGMSNPGKVLGFLDIMGEWDPSLALVMASALTTLILAQKFFLRSPEPVKDSLVSSCDANRSGIDINLIAGACIFGIGWGLSGICPGPAFVGLVTGHPGSLVFFISMYAGFIAFRWVTRNR